jgi:hypothetical protein
LDSFPSLLELNSITNVDTTKLLSVKRRHFYGFAPRFFGKTGIGRSKPQRLDADQEKARKP